MAFDDLMKTLRNAGIYPIPVVSIHERNIDYQFEGALSEYLEVLSASKVTTVLVGAIVVTEGLFEYYLGDNEVDSQEPYIIYLSTVEPKVSAYNSMIGEI